MITEIIEYKLKEGADEEKFLTEAKKVPRLLQDNVQRIYRSRVYKR
jgi:hypothetical protein